MSIETGITFAGVAFTQGLSLLSSTISALSSKCHIETVEGQPLLRFEDSSMYFTLEPLYSEDILVGYRVTSVKLGEQESDWKGLFIGSDPDKTAKYFKNRRPHSTVLSKNLSGVLSVISQTKGELHLNFFVDSSCRALRMIWINGKCRLVDLFAEPLAVFTAQTVMKF